MPELPYFSQLWIVIQRNGTHRRALLKNHHHNQILAKFVLAQGLVVTTLTPPFAYQLDISIVA